MSVIKVKQVSSRIKGLFESLIPVGDTHNKDAMDLFLSRGLAAFAIMSQTGCTAEEAAASVWDRGDDNGIDAVRYDPFDKTVIFVQSKWIHKGGGEPAAESLGTFAKGVEDAVENRVEEFSSELHEKLEAIQSELETPGTKIRLVVVSTGKSSLARHGRARLEKLLKQLNGDSEQMAELRVLGLAEVYSALSVSDDSGVVDLKATIRDWSRISDPYSAYFGTIDGAQLKDWWVAHGRRVVSQNIRHALGATDVNLTIQRTAEVEPAKFWYFNNGITLTVRSAVKAPTASASRATGVFDFKGASIVNGAQTVSSLARVVDPAALGEVRVPVRVVVLDGAPVGFGDEVTRTNNMQNRIEGRDFVAQDPQQARIREEMAMESIAYHYVRGERPPSSGDACDLMEATTALACASGDPSLVVLLKSEVGRFFVDLSKSPYRSIFNPSVSGVRVFNVVRVQRMIDSWTERRKGHLPKKSGVEWGVLVHGNRILSAAVFGRLDREVFERPVSLPGSVYSEDLIAGVCEKVFGVMVFSVRKHYSKSYLATLFKGVQASRHLYALAGEGK